MDPLNSSTVDELCRLCLGEDAAIPVFDEGSEANLRQMIMECVSIDIIEGDKLPTFVCKSCVENVNTWRGFKENCDKTQEKLQLWLENQQSTPKEGTEAEAEKTSVDKNAPILCALLAHNINSPDDPHSDTEHLNNEPVPSKDVIEIESDDQNSVGDNDGEKDSQTDGTTEPTVSIKIESTHSLSMDIFNNYDLIENNQMAVNGNPNEPANETDSGNDGPRIENNNTAEVIGEVENNKRKRTPSLSEDVRPARIPCIDGSTTITAEDTVVQNPPVSDEIVEPGTNNCLLTDQSDNSSVAEVSVQSPPPSGDNNLDQSVPLCRVKQEPVDIEDLESEQLQFSQVSVKAEALDNCTEYEEESVNESVSLQEESDHPQFLCETCDKSYGSRGNLLRHLGCKSHKLRALGITYDLKSERQSKQAGPESSNSNLDDSRTRFPRRCKSNSSFDSDNETSKYYDRMLEKEDVQPARVPEKRREEFECKPCKAYYRSQSDLERHYLSIKHQTALAKQNSLIENTYLQDHSGGRTPIEDNKIFACPVETCDLTFSSGLLLISHMKRHGIISNMSKELISSNFVNPPSTPPRPASKTFVCHKCGMKFNSPIHKSNHLRQCTGVPRYVPTSALDGMHRPNNMFGSKYCPICNLHIADEVTFISHMEMYHKGSAIHQTLTESKKNHSIRQNVVVSKPVKSGLYKCKMCPASFNFLHALRVHMKRHIIDSQSKPFVCKVCKKVFIQIKMFRIHLRKHFLPEGSKQLLCISCYQAFDNRSQISKHKQNGKCCPIKIKIYSCNICNHSYNKLSSLEEHKAVFHENGPSTETIDDSLAGDVSSVKELDPYCVICDKMYSSKANYRRHLKIHETDPSLASLKCLTCHRDFPTGDHLNMHMKICNMENVLKENNVIPKEMITIQCKYCDKVFSSQKSLKAHLLAHCPVFVRKYKKCLKCGKYVPQRFLNRDWSCKYCSKVMVNRSPQKIVAEKSVLFQCPLGQKQFMRRSSMINHYSSCNGNCSNTSAFSCKICKERFPDISKYNEHKMYCQKVLTTEPPVNKTGSFPCSYCSRLFSKPQYRATHEISCYRQFVNNDSSITSEPVEQNLLPTCTVCNATFRTMKILSLHKKKYRKQCSKLGAFSRKYSCQFCGNANLFQPNFYKHTCYCIKKILKINYQVVCQTCNRRFVSNENPREFSLSVQGHIIDCFNVPYHPDEVPQADSTKVLCIICGFCFISNDSLKTHTLLVHCSKSKAAGALSNKEPVVGETSNTTEVELAPTEPEVDTLNVEEEVKDQEKTEELPLDLPEEVSAEPVQPKYKCPYCVKTFQLMKSLVYHKSTKHKSVKNRNLKCKVCHRQFFSLAKLENHEKVHGIIRENVFPEFEESEKHSEEEGRPSLVEETVDEPSNTPQPPPQL